MPKRNEPKSLSNCSMRTIARNFELLCYNCKNSKEMAQLIESDSYLKFESPFVHIPSTLCNGIFDAVRELGIVRKQHLHALIQPSLDEFSLSEIGDKNMACTIVKERCKRLRRLSLSYLRDVCPLAFLKLIPNLTLLQDIDLSTTEIIDQILDVIGSSCPDIRSVNVSSCPISNRGVSRMVFDVKTQTKRCQKLSMLNVDDTMVSEQGLSFVLQIVPTLKELVYNNSLQIFNINDPNCVRLASLGEMNNAKFHLRQLTSTGEFLEPIVVDVAFGLCPFITNITLTNSIVENEVLYKTMTLDYLTHLRLTNGDTLSMDFYEGVLPVLTVKGHQILSLLLVKFTSVDISAIGECCPRLENLALSEIATYEDQLTVKEDYFKNLNALEIWSNLGNSSLGQIHFKQLLRNCNKIHNLLVSGTKALSDEVLLEVWTTNKMKDISRVTFDNCPSISRTILDILFDSVNKLILFRIWNCFQIKKEDELHYQKRVRDENCDTYFEWYPWQG